MAVSQQTIETVRSLTGDYKYSFVSDIESELAPKGLNDDTERFISARLGHGGPRPAGNARPIRPALPATNPMGDAFFMANESYGDNSATDTFEAMKVTDGPTDEYWQRHLIFIRGAKAALRFDDRTLTERMRIGYDTDEDALDPIRAWALTERQLVAAIEILRAAQARCTLAISRVGMRAGDPAGADKAKGAAAKM